MTRALSCRRTATSISWSTHFDRSVSAPRKMHSAREFSRAENRDFSQSSSSRRSWSE